MTEPRVIKLREPIAFGEEQITELTLKPFKAKFLKGFPIEGQTMDHVFTILARMTGRPPSVIEELGGEDFAELSGVIADFLPRGPATGQPA